MSDPVPGTHPRHRRHGSNIGQPMTRRDGIDKVTGSAPYAADRHPEGMAHAVLAVSAIANGRVTRLDVDAARAHPGVIEVMTPENRPALAIDPDEKSNPYAFRLDMLQNDGVRYAGQPIAVVIAETLEAANEGVSLLRPQYEAQVPRVGLDQPDPFVPPVVGPGAPAQAGKGDVEPALDEAVRRIEAVYETPPQYHNAMEPHAVVATWSGEKLHVDMPTQGMAISRGRIAEVFGIPPENIQIRSPFLGGGFGSKGLLPSPVALGILAARMVGRPVKLVLRRDQMFGSVGHRGATRQTIRLAMDDSGHLTALSHDTLAATSTFDDFIEPASNTSHTPYATPAIATSHRGVRVHTGTPGFMRAPGEATGSIALESAIDEAAYACGMDPLAFRLTNYADVEPISGKPFSSKALRECYEKASKAFGWDGRPIEPGTMRDDDGMLIGLGMGTALFPVVMFEGNARAILRDDGTGRVEIGAHDMGQGAWTALAQISADSLGLDLSHTEFVSGHSDLPDAGMAGGSGHTATAGSAIHHAGEAVIARLAELASADPSSPLYGADNAGVEARDGRLYVRGDDSRSERYADILRRAGKSQIEASGKGAADAAAKDQYAMYAHGAVFAEVKIDPDFGQVHVSRMVGAFAAGQIINPRMVESQLFGGMIWGLSFALHEQAITDRRTGRIVNGDLAEYHVPVNADVPPMQAILVEEDDPHINPLGVKGVGEIGITGSAGAIANAVWHATGKRIRRFPITPEAIGAWEHKRDQA